MTDAKHCTRREVRTRLACPITLATALILPLAILVLVALLGGCRTSPPVAADPEKKSTRTPGKPDLGKKGKAATGTRPQAARSKPAYSRQFQPAPAKPGVRRPDLGKAKSARPATSRPKPPQVKRPQYYRPQSPKSMSTSRKPDLGKKSQAVRYPNTQKQSSSYQPQRKQTKQYQPTRPQRRVPDRGKQNKPKQDN